jgi:hypothetical protein
MVLYNGVIPTTRSCFDRFDLINLNAGTSISVVKSKTNMVSTAEIVILKKDNINEYQFNYIKKL